MRLGKQVHAESLFQVTLLGYGYTFVTTVTTARFVRELEHEANVYARLRLLQGVRVLVFLGAVDIWEVGRTYYYYFQVHIVVIDPPPHLQDSTDRVHHGTPKRRTRPKRCLRRNGPGCLAPATDATSGRKSATGKRAMLLSAQAVSSPTSHVASTVCLDLPASSAARRRRSAIRVPFVRTVGGSTSRVTGAVCLAPATSAKNGRSSVIWATLPFSRAVGDLTSGVSPVVRPRNEKGMYR